LGKTSAEGPAAVVLVVDDDPKVAATLRHLLVASGYSVPEVVLRAADLQRALAAAKPDLVLMDIELGFGPSGVDLAAIVPAEVPVLFVSAHADPATLAKVKKLKPAGFVVKPYEARQLRAAVEMALARRLSTGGADAPLADQPELASLSAREREVLEQLLSHKRAPAIAKALFISQHTVRNHLKKIFAKLQVGSQQELLDRLTRRAR
jgi:DNA-binding NarL/FixJ family response regulator